MKSEYSSSQKHSELRGNIPQRNLQQPPSTKQFSLTHNFLHLLAFVLVFACAFPAFANDPVSYVNRTADANSNVTEEEATCTDYTEVTSSLTTWSSGWYVVDETLSGEPDSVRRSNPDCQRRHSAYGRQHYGQYEVSASREHGAESFYRRRNLQRSYL